MGVTSSCGEAEKCVVGSLVSLRFRGFFVAVACRAVCRLAAFFVAVDASDSGES